MDSADPRTNPQDNLPDPTVSIPRDSDSAPPGPATPKPRTWVLVLGGWMALCWLTLILSALLGAWAVFFLALLAMIPVNLIWRFRYWRARKTPEYQVLKNAPAGGFSTDHILTGMSFGGGIHEGNEKEFHAAMAAADRKQERNNYMGRFFQRRINRGFGAMAAGFVFPVRDAWREYRWSRGKGRSPVI